MLSSQDTRPVPELLSQASVKAKKGDARQSFRFALRDTELARIRRALLEDMAEAKRTGCRRFDGRECAFMLTLAMGFRGYERTYKEPLLKIFRLLLAINNTGRPDSDVLAMAVRIDHRAREAMIFRMAYRLVDLPDGSRVLRPDRKSMPPKEELKRAVAAIEGGGDVSAVLGRLSPFVRRVLEIATGGVAVQALTDQAGESRDRLGHLLRREIVRFGRGAPPKYGLDDLALEVYRAAHTLRGTTAGYYNCKGSEAWGVGLELSRDIVTAYRAAGFSEARALDMLIGQMAFRRAKKADLALPDRVRS